MELLQLVRLWAASLLPLLAVAAAAIARPPLTDDSPLLPLALASEPCLETEGAVEPLVAILPHLWHWPWPFLPLLHRLLTRHLALEQAYCRLFEETVELLFQVWRTTDVCPLASLVTPLVFVM